MSSTQESSTVADMRGQMFRAKRHMPDAGAREFLRQQMTAHVGTVDANGWPYVVPLVYVYEDPESLAATLARAIASDSPAVRVARRQAVDGETWTARVAQLSRAVDDSAGAHSGEAP